MWIEDLLKDIEKTKFSLHKLFKNPITNESISCIDYINLVLEDFLNKQKQLIISMNGLNKLELIENNFQNINNQTAHELSLKINCNSKLTNLLITYIYWKYMNPNSKLKHNVNMMIIKKIFKIKDSFKEHITPIACTTNCYLCKGYATVAIFDYDQSKLEFKCNTCGHSYKINLSDKSKAGGYRDVQYTKCNCHTCSTITSNINSKTINKFNELKDTCINLIEDSNQYIDLPSNFAMQNAYDIYMSNTNEQIDEILKYNPTSLEQFKNILNNISNSNYNNYDYETLLSKLENHGIVYHSKKKKPIKYKELFISYLLHTKNQNNCEEMFQKISSTIFNGDFFKYLNINNSRNDISINFNLSIINKSSSYFHISSKTNCERLKDYLYEDSLYINPYFINLSTHKSQNPSYRDELINEINSRIQDYSESRLKFVLNSLDSLEKFDSKN
ncbi:hypothetical protein CBE01nite_29900 [Clostridium beijerinckii]|uniref:Uncharacterized protein n=1 Tax=Clostridium beijerinckii TaxID=1520 RepID=A0AB74VDG1_CLOBE|nr:hypothetical protein [Clostridium beijerinckii]NRZ28769.1 hypothetical protein [Clostridium beijerinckii]NYB95455.1 hypothetical protein [Clostridium beijerinckii]OOM24570.1 hypothetical protein CLBEI_20310 [Clostridium beijerinckii]QUN34445.1 hypothetical protein KEC93_21360 [Clostridium beijerinckii]SQB00599.1 Uncharacterised protein [Clostridium beijerinckii]